MAETKVPASNAAAPPKGAGKPGEGKKILGMPRRTAVIAGVALAGGVAFILWRNHQAASAAGSGTGTSTDTGGSASGDTAGVQGGAMQGATGTETLVIKIRNMQGRRQHHKRPVPIPVDPHPHPRVPPRRPPHEPPPRRSRAPHTRPRRVRR